MMPAAMWPRAMARKARGEIASNEAPIHALRELGTAINKDLQTRIPRLRTLATELEGKGVIGVELYYPVREGKVVLYQMGISGNKTMGKASKGGWSAVD